jgi:hypothetical protein
MRLMRVITAITGITDTYIITHLPVPGTLVLVVLAGTTTASTTTDKTVERV